MPSFSFLHTLFLAGLASVALPIIIHLLFKLRKKTVIFSTLRFLRKVTEEKARRMRIKEWLLLAIRLLAFILITLAFARPYLRDIFLNSGQQTDTVLLLDDSYSMSARYGEETGLAQARERALEILKEMKMGDRAGLVTVCSGGEILQELTEDLALVRRAVQQLRGRPLFARYWPALKRATNLLNGSGRKSRKLVFITDGQLASWEGMSEARSLEGLGKEIAFEPHLIGNAGASGNIALLNARAPRKIWSKDSFRIAAKVANYTADRQRNLKLVFRWDRPPAAPGKSRALRHSQSKSFGLDPGEVRTLSIVADLDKKEDIVGEVFLQASDSLELDNHYYFAVTAEDAIRVLCVEDWEAPKPYLQSTYYLRRALEPVLPTGEKVTGYVSTRLVTTELLGTTDLRPYQVIVLADVARLPAAVSEKLEAFLRGGGGLVVFAGEELERASYNQFLAKASRGWVPARLQEKKGDSSRREDFWSLVLLEKNHELFRPFAESSASALGSARFFRYQEVIPQDGARLLATYDNDAPAIVELRTGKGAVIFFTSSCNADWTDLPKWGTYLPLVHQLVRTLAPRNRDRRSNLRMEEALSAAFGGSRPIEELRKFTAFGPGGKLFPVTESAPAPGLYFISGAGRSQLLRSVAVNLNTRESNPERVDAAAIAELSSPSGGAEKADAIAASGKSQWEERGRASPLWRYLLLAVIGLLFLELLVANFNWAH